MPDAVLIAGANGAGKTTFARQVVPSSYPAARFLNVDEIQLGERAFAHPIAAGRELLRRLEEAEGRGDDFVIETTLSSRMYVKHISEWMRGGYRITLHFIEVPSEEFAVRRVAARVAAGGHAVPEADVRRRYWRGLVLFEEVYKSLVDRWYHWVSDDEGLRLVDRSAR